MEKNSFGPPKQYIKRMVFQVADFFAVGEEKPHRKRLYGFLKM
jgi:hypothetical protein